MSVIPEETVESEVVVDGGEEIIEEPAVEQPDGEPEGEPDAPEETPEAEPAPDGDETPDEDAPDDSDAAVEDDKPAEPVVEAVVFEPELETAALVEKGKKILDEFDIPQPIQAYVEALEAKANADPMAAYSDYGDTDAVKTMLDRQSFIDGAREIGDGQYRPNTDQFVEVVAKGADGQNRLDWLFHDISGLPSVKYQGLSRLEETIVDALAVDGDTVSGVKQRYDRFIEAFRSNALPDSSVPNFIPKNLHEAYFQLARTEREDIELLDSTEDAELIRSKLSTLQSAQRGINADRADEQRLLAAQAKEKSDYTNEVQSLRAGFFKSLKSNFREQLTKGVTFSTNPDLQKFLVGSHVSVLEQALDPTPTGDDARQTLADAGIRFDAAKAQQLDKAIEQASVLLARHKRAVDDKGEPLDRVALNKAQREFEKAGLECQKFAKDILDQEARFTSTGKAEEIKKEVEKKKIEAKARLVPKGATTTATKKESVNPHPYRSPQYYEWYANAEIEAQQKKAAMYANA